MTVWPHTTHQHGSRIIDFRHARGEHSCRWLIDRRWRLHVSCFVWTDLVVFLAEAIQRPLLLTAVRRRWLGRFLFQRTMHSFMPAILLRMPRSDAFRHDPQFDPPHCQ